MTLVRKLVTAYFIRKLKTYCVEVGFMQIVLILGQMVSPLLIIQAAHASVQYIVSSI